MEDDDVVYEEHYASDHPAHFDQQLSKIRDLLPEAKGFIVCLLIPDDEWTSEHQSASTHVMIGKVPGISTSSFLSLAMRDIVETANTVLMQEQEDENDRRDITEE